MSTKQWYPPHSILNCCVSKELSSQKRMRRFVPTSELFPDMAKTENKMFFSSSSQLKKHLFLYGRTQDNLGCPITLKLGILHCSWMDGPDIKHVEQTKKTNCRGSLPKTIHLRTIHVRQNPGRLLLFVFPFVSPQSLQIIYLENLYWRHSLPYKTTELL